MRSVLVSVKYRYCWVDSGRDGTNGFDDDGLLAAGLKVRSATAVAGLFLEVIVRHIPGLVGSLAFACKPHGIRSRVFYLRELSPSVRVLA